MDINLITWLLISMVLGMVMILVVDSEHFKFYSKLIGVVGITVVITFLFKRTGPKQVPPEEMRQSIRDFKKKYKISEINTPKMFQEEEMQKWTS